MLIFSFAHGASYGSYEPRALAMGGTGVAVGNAEQAVFYNPALLGFSEGKEEKTQNGRVYFPSLLLQASSNIESGRDILEEELDVQLTRAVDNYNANPSETNAASVLNATRRLESAVNTLGNDEVNVEGIVGFNISEPGHHQGGGFYMASRLIAFGQSNVPEADSELLNNYIDALELIANGNADTATSTYPELFDGTELIDPADNITSSADVGALTITEWGIAAAKQFTLFDQDISFGITPKAQRITVFREQILYGDADFDYSADSRVFWTMNMDMGMAAIVGKKFRLGLAIKDAIPKSLEAENGLAINIQPKIRFGSAYFHKYATFAFDIDLVPNSPIAAEAEIQEASLGIEAKVWKNLKLRMGYQHELSGIYGDTLTTGIGWRWHRFVTDFTLVNSSEKKGIALQFGLAF